MAKILQLKISLLDTQPQIWRRVLVKGGYTFYDLHYIIQLTMGWEDYHLYEFHCSGLIIGNPEADDAFVYEADEAVTDARNIKIDEVLSKEGETLIYKYDFGDGWKHLVKVEKVLDEDTAFEYPVLLEGALSAPPEDCGGISGFYNLLKILKSTAHPQHKEMADWAGKEYDPKKLDIAEINSQLQKLME